MLVDTDPRDGPVWKKSYLTRLHQAGKLMAADGGLPFSSVRKTLMEAPVYSLQALPVAAQGEAEEELIRLLQQGRAEDALRLCQLLKLYHFHENRPMFAWAEALARRDMNRVTGDAARAKEFWKQPLVEELNKEVYNFAADLHAIVESGALEDASRMIASLEADHGSGLTPSGSDRSLFVSLSGAVKLALAQQPALRAELTERLAPLAALRVRQAIASGDEAAIALAATQFEGTEAAAEAYRWLGDRALQNGWFTRAQAEYRRAEASASPSLSRELQPRTRLAAAMTGSDYGSAVTETVSFGDARMTPTEFEALVAEMKARGAGPVQGTSQAAVINLPGPSQITAQNRARMDGPVGQNPNDDGAPRLSQWQIDYAGRQLATALDGDIMYVSNRFQVAAYNATSGQRLWQSQTPAGEMRRGQDWALTAMRPLVTGSAIYARQLYGKTPTLACFEKAGGKLLWQRDGTDNEWWVSDPVLVQGQLLALSLSRDGNREAQLRLASLDPFTGEILVQRRLIALRESWQPRKVCEIAALDDGLVASLGGITLCCDAAGSVRWVRKHLALPHEERPEWVFQHFAPPLVIDSRYLLSVQPGVETIDCLEVTTGRLLWSFSQERPWRLLGRSGQRVIAETESGLVALDLADGKVAWRRDEPQQRLTAAAVSDKHVLYMVRRGAADKPRVPALVWLDAADGRQLGSVEFPQWQDNDPRIGPLVVAKDRLWTFFSKEKDPNKDLVELTSGAPLPTVNSLSTTSWQRTLSPTLAQTVSEVASGWELVSGYARANVEKKAEWQGEKDAALILSRPDLPAALATSVQLPEGKKPKLNLRIGHEGHPPGQFTIRADGETMLTQEWKPETGNRWDSLVVDLSKFAGKQVVISLAYRPSTGNDHALWLKSAQIVAE
jgi:outer membrane protein assembly factor BamB